MRGASPTSKSEATDIMEDDISPNASATEYDTDEDEDTDDASCGRFHTAGARSCEKCDPSGSSDEEDEKSLMCSICKTVGADRCTNYSLTSKHKSCGGCLMCCENVRDDRVDSKIKPEKEKNRKPTNTTTKKKPSRSHTQEDQGLIDMIDTSPKKEDTVPKKATPGLSDSIENITIDDQDHEMHDMTTSTTKASPEMTKEEVDSALASGPEDGGSPLKKKAKTTE